MAMSHLPTTSLLDILEAPQPTSVDPILADLNDQQLQAVTVTDGPILIIAGAGTGKTSDCLPD
jgi:DNA helicase-2/ATP-dependent DNA helicase PcrA